MVVIILIATLYEKICKHRESLDEKMEHKRDGLSVSHQAWEKYIHTPKSR